MGAGGYVCLALALLGLGFGLYQWYSGRPDPPAAG